MPDAQYTAVQINWTKNPIATQQAKAQIKALAAELGVQVDQVILQGNAGNGLLIYLLPPGTNPAVTATLKQQVEAAFSQ